ncbi:VWA domain-containing protein [Stieleria varia]|uniref:VWFA domain-containing protein n=1 Tax=Stieleria varia TaxID=2528005 RepID=A0A5C6APD7_9BACT|nr:VWA domain-containing protein [Stieleria varia]TWU00976.1 hypothetical protein Pla52n_43460 [Stieleria varia]
MRDLDLWQFLEATEVDSKIGSTSVSPLEQLAERSLRQRAPFVSLLIRWLDSPDASVRRAILLCLAGCRGVAARRALVNHLDDDDASVRQAALDTISVTPTRSLLVHALFHPRCDVRLAAIESATKQSAGMRKNNADLLLYLLCDPETRQHAIDYLATSQIDRLPFMLVSAMHAAKLIDDTLARRIVLMADPRMIIVLLSNWSESDDIDSPPVIWLLSLFWDQDTSEPEAVSNRFPKGFFHALIESISAPTGNWVDTKFALRCRDLVHQRGRWNPLVARLCLIGLASRLDWLVDDVLPLDVFREVADELYRVGMSIAEVPVEVVRGYLKSPWCRRESGQLDLRVIGAILHLRRRDGFQVLLSEFKVTQITAGFDERPAESAMLFSYPGSSKEQNELIEAVFANRSKDPFAIAIMLCVVPASGLRFVASLTSAEMVKTLRELYRLTDGDEWSVSVNKSAAIAHQFCRQMLSGQKLDEIAFREFLQQWLTDRWLSDTPIATVWIDSADERVRRRARFSVGVDLVTEVIRSLDNEWIVVWMIDNMTPVTMAQFLSVVPYCSGLSYAFEMTLAQRLIDHPEPALAQWAADRVSVQNGASGNAEKEAAEAALEPGSSLSPANRHILINESAIRMHALAVSLIGKRCVGVVDAIRERGSLTTDDERVAACIALFASADSPIEIATTLVTLGCDDERVYALVVPELIRHAYLSRLGPLGFALMHRWEFPAFSFGRCCMADESECIAWLEMADRLAAPVLAQELVRCIAHVTALYIARENTRAEELLGKSLLETWLERLPTQYSVDAAGVLMRAFKRGINRAAFVQMQTRALEIIPELSAEVQFRLRPWVDSTRLGSVAITRQIKPTAVDSKTRDAISRCMDRDRLSAWLRDRDATIVVDAVIRLIELGHTGIECLVDSLLENPPLPCAQAIAETVLLWPADELPLVVGLIGDRMPDNRKLPDSTLFHFTLYALVGFGDGSHVEFDRDTAIKVLSDVMMRPCTTSWIQSTDMTLLLSQLSHDEIAELCCRWTQSMHPNVYRWAVLRQVLRLDNADVDHAPVIRSLEQFLQIGTDRDQSLRVKAAVALARKGNWIGFPILLTHRLEHGVSDANDPLARLPMQWVPDKLVVPAVESLLAAGPDAISEIALNSLIDFQRMEIHHVKAAERVMRDAMDDNVRQGVATMVRGHGDRPGKLRRIAGEFKRGVQVGRELTGRLFSIEMIGGSDYGYTRLTEDRIYINPMPLLTGVPHAEDIVQGLIVHEIGHHMYHRGRKEEMIWRSAQKQGLGQLLNLVADEHLERNLRALDRNYGNQLKRLGAYAFNRGAKDMAVDQVLRLLRENAFDVLRNNPPTVARAPECLHLRGGMLLQDLERCGSSFARFFRAMRLGLGNRHDDPKVAEGLALFDKSFRKLDMFGLMRVCKQLRRIFGDDACMNGFPTLESLLSDSDGDLAVKADGISNDDIQREILRVTKPPSADGGSGGPLVINVGDDLQFNLIHRVQRLPYLPDAYRPLAEQVGATSRQFRDFLRDLGLSQVRRPRRIRGRSVDAGGLRNLVLRGDPRVLVAREVRYHNDLFLSVVVDCSGSMDTGDSMPKARLFAAMMAEACRGLAGVDLRIFGFTDNEIYDAGDAMRPAIAELSAGGGNNDAAALWHAAGVAKQSRRSAKVLVMISDGLPTECSTQALAALEQRLSRQSDTVCAQVAVRPLTEICFQNYIELTDTDIAVSVRRFGAIVAKLVKQMI